MNQPIVKPNVKQTIPFFMVSNMEVTLRFYVEGLGFRITNKWVPENRIEWCSLRRGEGMLMLQEPRMNGHNKMFPQNKVGVGVSICFICEDALELYHEFLIKELEVSEPFVGNNMWVISVDDPDGYNIQFESATDVPEETKYSEWAK